MIFKKFLAGVLACCVVGGACPTAAMPADNAVFTASAFDEYTDGKYESLSYRNYGDYIEILYCSKSTASVVIPAKIDDVPVTSIDGAFYGCTKLTEIIIPDSVTNIDNMSFCGCEKLTSIEIPDSVTSIGEWTFRDCKSLKSITIPDSVTSIGKQAFFGCSSLTSITIPTSVTSIGEGAFGYCSGLTAINVSDNNKNYADIDGVLFNKDKTELLSYPMGKSETKYTIPDSVTSIADGVFYNCSELTEIVIPDGVTSIGEGSFSHCSGLTEIVIPDSILSIGDDAFNECTELTEIKILNPNCEIYDYERTISNGYDEDHILYFGGTIYGYENSTAQAYAEKYGRKFIALDKADTTTEPATGDYLAGDANADGEVTVADAAAILQYLGNNEAFALTDQGKKNGDVDGSEGLTPADALAIQKFKAGLVDKLPL